MIKIKGRKFPKLEIDNESITGTYKGREFNIFKIKKGNAYYNADIKRYNIDVKEVESGMYDVQTYEECKNIQEALEFALKGALL